MFNSRGVVVGIPIGFMFAGMFLTGVLPDAIVNLTPWAMVSSLAMELADDTEKVISWVPVVSSIGWIAALASAAVWRFKREEFLGDGASSNHFN